MKPTSLRIFKPQVRPRNWADCFLSALASLPPIVVFLAQTNHILQSFLFGAWWHGSLYMAFWLAFLVALFVWSLRTPVQHLELSEDGIRVIYIGANRLVRWEDVERIEELSVREVIRAMVNPDLYTGRIRAPASFTFTAYVLISHKGASILFPAPNKEGFLQELRKYWGRKTRQQDKELVKPTPWYWTASQLREENQQTLRSRSGE